MFLRCLAFSRKDGSQRKYLQIVQTYRESGRVRQKIVANLGRLDELIASGTLEKLSDALSRYVEKKELLCKAEELMATSARSFGPVPIFTSLWKKLGLPEAIESATKRETATYDPVPVIFRMVLGRLLDPASKLSTHRWAETIWWDDGAHTGGQLTWTGGGHNVRIPMVVLPVALAAPAQVSGIYNASYNVKFGYDGPFTATARGLMPATTFAGSVMTGNFTPVASPSAVKFDVVVPAGTTYARFSLFDADSTSGSDLDLYVYNGTTLVGASAGYLSNEEVNLLNPAADTYTVWVHGFKTSNPSSFTLFAWVLGSAPAGNMTVVADPASATLGGTGAINLNFSGLTAGMKYLGAVAYGGSPSMPNPTIVRVDP